MALSAGDVLLTPVHLGRKYRYTFTVHGKTVVLTTRSPQAVYGRAVRTGQTMGAVLVDAHGTMLASRLGSP
jgi:hypothetical protein